MKRSAIKYGVILLPVLMLSLSFNNCSGTIHESLDNPSTTLSVAACDIAKKEKYRTTVYAFLAQDVNCGSCHREGGGGNGTFASPDIDSAYNSFRTLGLKKILDRSVDAQHKPPHTGPLNQPTADNLTIIWAQAETDYNNCVAGVVGGGGGPKPESPSLKTSLKPAPATVYSTTTAGTITYQLDLQTNLDPEYKDRKVPVTFSIQVARNTTLPGYAFSNPIVTLKDTSIPYMVDGLSIYVNGNLASDLGMFFAVSAVLNNGTPYALRPGQTGNTKKANARSIDLFSFEFRRIVPMNFGSNAPMLLLSDAVTGSRSFISSTAAVVNITHDDNVARWCLTTSSVMPANVDAPCVGQTTTPGTVNGWYSTRPTSFTLTAGDGVKTVYLWVADQALKVGELMESTSITLDTTLPPAPTLTAVTAPVATGDQFANITIAAPGVTTDVSGYCVFERSAGLGTTPPTPAFNDPCWTWTVGAALPTTVAFRGGGARNIWAFTRDAAGNRSLPSAMIAQTNSLGPITLTDLNNATLAAGRGVFAQNCNSCHSDVNNANAYNAIQLTIYADVVISGTQGTLTGRINDDTRPMPVAGLMTQRKRDLIKLWLLPENGGAPLQ